MDDYVSSDVATLKLDGRDETRELLWGDGVEVLDSRNGEKKVRARNMHGWIDEDDLGADPLLELYIIDVGQGDGMLLVTPDRRHVMVDGGYRRQYLPTGKSAADFVDWKFATEYGRDRIELDAMIATHCDSDHYGGLHDLVATGEDVD